jgi:hypothetical protein
MKSPLTLWTAYTVLVFLLCQCKNDTQVELQIMEDETKCITLTQKLRLLEMQSNQAHVITESDVQSVNEAAQKAMRKLVEMRLERSSLHADIHSLEGEFEKAKRAVIAHKRNSAMGRSLAVFATKQRTYQDITIQSVTEAGLEIKHSSGSARITPMQLSAAQLEEFGLSVENALEVIAAERQQQQNYMASVDRVVEKQQEQERNRAQKAEEHRRALQKAEANIAAYRAPVRKSALSDTPPTRVYRVRSTQPRFYNVWYPYSTYGSCRSYSSPNRIEVCPSKRIDPIIRQTP